MLEAVNIALILFLLKWLRSIEKRLATLEGRLYNIENDIGRVRQLCQENASTCRTRTYSG